MNIYKFPYRLISAVASVNYNFNSSCLHLV